MSQKSYRLQEIADALGASLRGDPDIMVSGLATLQAAGPDQISFLANPAYGKYLQDTRAGAVILSPVAADDCPTNVLLLDNPYMGYARLSHWFDPAPVASRSEEHTSELQSRPHLVCRLLLEKKNKK